MRLIKIKKIVLFILLISASLILVHFALAADGNLDVGLQYGEATGLGQEDPRVIAANIIRIILGFLGIVAVGLVIYAGWLWMTAAGDDEKINKAKKILLGAVIGLVICLASFAIATFVLNKLLSATGAGGTGGTGGDEITPGGGVEVPCDGNTITAGCQADTSLCGVGQYCSSTSCTCQNTDLPDAGEPCLTDILDTTCSAGSCAAGLICSDGCICRESNAPGEGESCDGDSATAGCQAIDCASNLVCASDHNCTCIKTPLISWVSPIDADKNPYGAPDNFITIGGEYFGTTPGKVIFLGDPANDSDDREAVNPISLNPECSNYWQDKQIVVAVPAGAVSGPLKVVDANNLWDRTDNNRGATINDFQLTSQKLPGLCLVSPSSGSLGDQFGLFGISLSGSNQKVLFGDGTHSISADEAKDWTNTSVNAKVPNLTDGLNAVFASVNSLNSNSLRFAVTSDINSIPVIEYLDPVQGPVGQYVTIYGRNFQQLKLGVSSVKFYLAADPTNLINANIDFPDECKDKYWQNSYIIVKVPQASAGAYKVIVVNGSTKQSQPADFTITSGSPGPGICLLDPHNGPVGQSIKAVGDNFGSSQGSGRTVFYNNVNGLVSSWASQRVGANVPAGAKTGPFKIINSSGQISNSLPFTVGNCSANNQCYASEECCGSGTYWSGICRASGTCSLGGSANCTYSWTFSTAANTSILTCGGYNTASACLASDMCPNSPGKCQTRTNVSLGECSNDSCNNNAICAGQCVFDSSLNKCKLSGAACDTANTTLISGYTAECRQVGSQSVWQIDSKASCPSGTFKDSNNKCTVGSVNNPSECDLCAYGYSCQSGQCVITSSGCPKGSTCQSGECIKDKDICECCCRVGSSAQDCCAGLTCQAGGCGSGAPNYGLCTGCKVIVGGAVDQAASDKACNCYGQPTRYCDLSNPGYPSGVCRDQAVAGESCYDAAAGTTCDSADPPCAAGLYCDGNDCTCKAGGSVGDPCDGNLAVGGCQANSNMCQAGLTCNSATCLCEPGGGSAGSECLADNLPACSSGVGSCLANYQCLDKDSADCRCCCNPADDKCEAPLECWANKEPCDTTARGLCCGCQNDGQCSGGLDGCSSDTCCRARPDVSLPLPGGSGVCRNTVITAVFDQAMDVSSFDNNFLLIADYETAECPAGTKFLSSNSGVANRHLISRIINRVLISLEKLLKPIFGQRALALADQTHNYCAVGGAVGGYNNTAGEGVITFAPDKALDSERKYYAVIKGDSNSQDSAKEGVLSSYGVSMVGSDSDTFNAKNFANAKIWSFITGKNVCRLEGVTVEPLSYLFQTSDNNPDDDTIGTSLFDTIRDSDKAYRAIGLAVDGQEILPLSGVYSWEWRWSIVDETVAKFRNLNNSNQQIIVAQNKKDDRTVVKAKAVITDDTVNKPATVGQTKEGEGNIYVMMCANPWPPVRTDNTWQPWQDNTLNCSSGLSGEGCLNNNFEIYYCRDAGGEGTADDLPAILNETVVRGHYSDLDILKEYYFLREDMPAITILLVSDQQTGGKVAASWDSVNGASGYKLYYGTASGQYANSVDVGNTTFRLIDGLTNNKTYYFAVTAYYRDTGAESGYSNEQTVSPTDKTAPAKPAGLVAQAADSQVALSWNLATDDAVSYKVYYGTSVGVYGDSAEIKIKDCSAGKCNLTIDQLTNGQTYYFAIKAIDAYNNESQAAEINATPVMQ